MRTLIIALTLAIGLGESLAQRPGIDRPIRVGMFKGIGTGGIFNHTNMHTAQSVMASLLANPAGAGLGDSLVIPPAGFTFYAMPVALNTAGTAECTGNSCGPTPEQLVTIVASLDTLDVLIMNSNTNIGSRITDSVHRAAFESFWATKGFVSVHATTDSYGTWPQQDSLQGTRFRGSPVEQDGKIRRDSIFMNEAAWKYLNRGMFSNGTDTTFLEEWFYFTNSGAEIRSRPNLKTTTLLDEASIVNPGNHGAMNDHPMSWYRTLPTGGRFFYTALGHRAQVWQTTRTFRRQLYNAILWTAKYDSIATVSVRDGGGGDESSGRRAFGAHARVTQAAGRLVVTAAGRDAHTVEVFALDGRRLAARSGKGTMEHEFTGLASGLHLITVTTPTGRHTQRIMLP